MTDFYGHFNDPDFNKQGFLHISIARNFQEDFVIFNACLMFMHQHPYYKLSMHSKLAGQISLRPPGGSIIDYSAHFDKAVLLSYAITLYPYNPMVLYSFNIEILTGFTIIKN